ncbi:MAG: transcription-repair coupling factor, partial [Acetatifactor sp.]|nr:transcription-repair coupling factor [Acetatifactor sp.]
LDLDAFIPPEYIVNEGQKREIYKRIAGIETVRERDDMRDELLDRFGAIPVSVENLLRIALIRVAAHRLYMTELKGKNERIIFTFRPDAPIVPERIPDFMKTYGNRLLFTAYGNPFFTYKYQKCNVIEKDSQALLSDTEQLLEAMAGLVDESLQDKKCEKAHEMNK